MAKQVTPAAPKATNPAPAVVVAAQATAAPTLYTLGKPYNPKANTLHGNGGCAGTWAAVQAALQAGPCTYAQLREIAVANGDAGFVAYRMRAGSIVPYVAAK
jgi:hypothetical protein